MVREQTAPHTVLKVRQAVYVRHQSETAVGLTVNHLSFQIALDSVPFSLLKLNCKSPDPCPIRLLENITLLYYIPRLFEVSKRKSNEAASAPGHVPGSFAAELHICSQSRKKLALSPG